MLKVRLQRVGRRNDPSFRVVVTESTRGPKSGKYIEMLGSYSPRQKTVALKGDRIKYWLSVGAQVTGTVHNLLIKEKITTGKKINVLPKKSPIKKEVVKDAAPEAPLKVETEGSSKSESADKEEQVEEQKEKEISEESDSKSETSASTEGEEPVKDEESKPDAESKNETPKEPAQ